MVISSVAAIIKDVRTDANAARHGRRRAGRFECLVSLHTKGEGFIRNLLPLMNVRGVLSPYRKFQEARRIPGYNESLHELVGVDLLATQYAACRAYAHIEVIRGNAAEAGDYLRKAAQEKALINGDKVKDLGVMRFALDLPIRQNLVDVRHEGLQKTAFTNASGPSSIWQATFPGRSWK